MLSVHPERLDMPRLPCELQHRLSQQNAYQDGDDGSQLLEKDSLPPNFFIQQYVYTSASECSLEGNHEYLPNLMRSNQESDLGLLGTVVAAVGLAALSNATNAPPWRFEAFRLYSKAINQLRDAVEDRTQTVSDQMLGAIVLMGTFEVRRTKHVFPVVIYCSC